jgi:hypothetical protein
VVEFDNNFNTTRKANKAEAAIMHPSTNIVALRAKTESGNGTIIQVIFKFSNLFTIIKIFNLDKKEKLKHVEL